MTYVHKKAIRSAIKYTGENREKIIDFLDIKKEDVEEWTNEDTRDKHMLIDAPSVQLGKVTKGQWITRGEIDFDIKITNDDDFKRDYIKIKEVRTDVQNT